MIEELLETLKSATLVDIILEFSNSNLTFFESGAGPYSMLDSIDTFKFVSFLYCRKTMVLDESVSNFIYYK